MLKTALSYEKEYSKDLFNQKTFKPELFNYNVIKAETKENTNNPGGIIIFSKVISNYIFSKWKIINWFKRFFKELELYGVDKFKKLDKILDKHNLVGKTLNFGVKNNYYVYDENNRVKVLKNNYEYLEIIGADEEMLNEIAKDICKEFYQNSVYIKNYCTNEIREFKIYEA